MKNETFALFATRRTKKEAQLKLLIVQLKTPWIRSKKFTRCRPARGVIAAAPSCATPSFDSPTNAPDLGNIYSHFEAQKLISNTTSIKNECVFTKPAFGSIRIFNLPSDSSQLSAVADSVLRMSCRPFDNCIFIKF